MIGAILIFLAFALVGLAGTTLIPSLPAAVSPTVTNPSVLYLVKFGLDSAVTLVLLLFWLWDPFHRYDSLKNSRLATAFSWIRFDTPCVREGNGCSTKNMLVFLWHMMFWTSAVSIRWWQWLDPCVSYGRATVDRCVAPHKTCDESTGMCQCDGYKDWSVLWTILRIDAATVAAAALMMFLFKGAFWSMGRDHGFWGLGQLLVRGAMFAGGLLAVRLVIEMGAMLFEGDAQLASLYLPSDVAGELKECYAKESMNDIIASCGAVLKAASVEERAKGGGVPKTVGKLLVMHSQVTTITVTAVVCAGVFLKWAVDWIRNRERPRPQTYDLPPPPEPQPIGNMGEDPESEEEEGEYDFPAAPELEDTARENHREMQEVARLNRHIRDLREEMQESNDPARIEELRKEIEEAEGRRAAIEKRVDDRKASAEDSIGEKNLELRKESEDAKAKDREAAENLQNSEGELEGAEKALDESRAAAKKAAAADAVRQHEAAEKAAEETGKSIDAKEKEIRDLKEKRRGVGVGLTRDETIAKQAEIDSRIAELEKQKAELGKKKEEGEKAAEELKKKAEEMYKRPLSEFEPSAEAKEAVAAARRDVEAAVAEKRKASERVEANDKRMADLEKAAHDSRLTDRQRMMESDRDRADEKLKEQNEKIAALERSKEGASPEVAERIDGEIKDARRALEATEFERKMAQEDLDIVNEATKLGKDDPDMTQAQIDAMIDQKLAEKKSERMQDEVGKDTQALDQKKKELTQMMEAGAPRHEIEKKRNEITRAEASNLEMKQMLREAAGYAREKRTEADAVNKRADVARKRDMRKLRIDNAKNRIKASVAAARDKAADGIKARAAEATSKAADGAKGVVGKALSKLRRNK